MSDHSASPTSPRRQKRRWFQFSVRALLLVVTLLAVWLGVRVNSARRQQAAVAAVREYGGHVYYDYQYDLDRRRLIIAEPWEPLWLLDLAGIDFFHQVVYVNLASGFDEKGQEVDNPRVTDEVLVHLPALSGARSLWLSGTQATDPGMKHVARLKDLERLGMGGAAVTDEGVARLTVLAHLKDLHISDAGLTDKSLEHLGRMTQLEKLSLRGNHFTNDGLKHLSGLVNLKELWLGRGTAPITDAGLVHLRHLTKLETLGLQWTQVTEAGAEELKGALPGLKSVRVSERPAWGVAQLPWALFNREPVPSQAVAAALDRVRPKRVAALEKLDRSQIPAEELEMAGGGDAAKAPAELVAVMGDSRLKHWSAVRSVAFSPGGKTIASASSDHTIKLWDAASGALQQTLEGHEDGVRCVAFHPGGDLLASAGDDKAVKIWDTGTGRLVRTFEGHEAPVSSLAFSSKEGVLATAGGEHGGDSGEIILWDAEGGRLVRRFEGVAGPVACVAFSPDGKLLLSGAAEASERDAPGEVTLWEVPGGQVVRRISAHKGYVSCVAFAPDGQSFFTAGGRDGTIKLWDLADEKPRLVIVGGGKLWSRVGAFALSPDGRILASDDGEGGLQLWELSTLTRLDTEVGDAVNIAALAFSPDGRTLASAGWDHAVRLWDVSSGEFKPGPDSRTRISHLRSGFHCLAFSPDGATLAAGGSLGWQAAVALWDLAEQQEGLLIGHTRAVVSVAFSPDGGRLATGGWRDRDGSAMLWDLSTRRPITTLGDFEDGLVPVAMSPDGKLLATGTWDDQGGSVKLWNATNGALLNAISEEDRCTCLEFSPSGQYLAWGGWKREAVVFDVRANRVRRRVGHADYVTAVALGPDSRSLAVAGRDKKVGVWDIETGELLFSAEGARDSVDFSPDGRRLAGSGGGVVHVWDAGTGERLERFALAPPGGQIAQVAFSPDGGHLATANGNATVYILRLAPDR